MQGGQASFVRDVGLDAAADEEGYDCGLAAESRVVQRTSRVSQVGLQRRSRYRQEEEEEKEEEEEEEVVVVVVVVEEEEEEEAKTCSETFGMEPVAVLVADGTAAVV